MRDDASHLFQFDQKLAAATKNPKSSSKYFCLIGIDEAGRGPWAGPVVAGAVALHAGFFHPQIDDSKKLKPKIREALAKEIKENSFWAVGFSEVETIDAVNILEATTLAMKNALQNLLNQNPSFKPDLILIDGRALPNLMGFPQVSVVQGDARSASIASASILAKVERDKIMTELDTLYPHYGFSKHKGYGTALHMEKLIQHGPSPIHRKSFAPVKEALKNFPDVYRSN